MSQSAAIASSTDGGSVAAYSDRDYATGKGRDVWLRRYLPDGSAAGVSQRVNTTLTGAQMNVDVAMRTADDYAVVWQSENGDGSSWGIYARTHTPAGWSNEFLVNQTTAGSQVSPSVAVAAGGDYVFAWVGRDDNGGNGQIYARRFDDSGVAGGGEVSVSQGGNVSVTAPDIAAAYNNITGAVAITWVSADLANASETDIAYRQYGADLGGPVSAVTTVNTTFAGDQAEPAIAALGSNLSDFVVAFSDTSGGGNQATIAYRRMNVGGATYPQVQVSQDSDGNRNRPRIASSGTTTIIGWTQQPINATYSGAVTRAFDRNLSPTSNEFFVTDGANARTLQGLAVTGNGTYRDVSTLAEFGGYGIATVANYANVLELDGTAGNDNIVLYDLDAGTFRANVNGVNHNYNRADYGHLHIELGSGNDILIANDLDLSSSTVGGGDGNDSILTGDNVDSIGGGDGDDSIDAGAGSDYAIGGSGNDLVRGGAGDDTLTGGAGKDTIYGGTGNDRLAGTGSPDVLQGEEGDDRLYGESGDDRCDGGGGRDRCYGGDGNDLLVGGSSNDRLFGEAGNDTLNGGAGNDYLDGGAGSDLAVKREAGDTLIDIEF